MPQIIIKGMKKQDIKTISKGLVDELQQIIGCPRDYFTIEAVEPVFILDGEEVAGTPFVQVNWFDRGQEVQDKAAMAIDECIRRVGYSQIDVFFLVLEESKYYENGKHY
jgi:hypothetical protein